MNGNGKGQNHIFQDYNHKISVDKKEYLCTRDSDLYSARTISINVHEIGHQAQYENLGDKKAFEKLIQEGFDGLDQKYNPYKAPGCLEYDAQQVENTAKDLLNLGWKPNTGVKDK